MRVLLLVVLIYLLFAVGVSIVKQLLALLGSAILFVGLFSLLAVAIR